MTDLRLLTYYLGIEVDQKKDCIMLKQSAYAKNLLQQFKMIECNPTKYLMKAKLQLGKDSEGNLLNSTEYRRVIGSLRYMEKPTMMHHQTIKHILCYVKGTTSMG
ncbi:uncharacterized protein LOC111472184 [Cucurbita maxima]|uniref:Uncharacterized protein LOC111472184 n=1 Tax=Cucurbita maxima TaxID=3661 RepID=A0A6J1IF14_CUCMA|nr:uncharacterized protein LOC111472184 [Cucurbita maxima]